MALLFDVLRFFKQVSGRLGDPGHDSSWSPLKRVIVPRCVVARLYMNYEQHAQGFLSSTKGFSLMGSGPAGI